MQQMTPVEGAVPPNQDHAAQDRPAGALAAKAGITAQAGGKAAEMKTRVAGVAGQAADRITAKAAGLRDQLPGKTSELTQAMSAGRAKVRRVTPGAGSGSGGAGRADGR